MPMRLSEYDLDTENTVPCGMCGLPAEFGERRKNLVVTGVTPDGYVLQETSPGIEYWRHADGRFCSRQEVT